MDRATEHMRDINCDVPTTDYDQVRKQLVDEDTEVFVVPFDWAIDGRTYVFSDMSEIRKSPVIEPLGYQAVERMSVAELMESYPDAVIYPGSRDYVKLQEILSYIPF